jgi:hypothetical protein
MAQLPVKSWSSCSDDLDTLRKRAADATDAANSAHEKGDDLDECRNDRETYDTMGDRCESKKSDYESAVSDLQSALGDVDARLRDIQTSCDYEFTTKMTSAEATQRRLRASEERLKASQERLCASYRRLLPLVTPSNVLQMCKAQQAEDWCKACIR